MKAFSDLTDTQELKDYLDRPLDHARGTVSHYTRLTSLLSILQSGTIRCSSFENTNDRLEYNLISDAVRERGFVSLARSSEESFGMWAMYGGLGKERNSGRTLKDIWVKISFRVDSLRRFVQEGSVRASMVAYTSLTPQFSGADRDARRVYFCGSVKNTKGIALDWSILSGYIKDSAWKYEQELHLWSKGKVISLDDGLLDSMQVTPSPLCRVKDCIALVEQSTFSSLLPRLRPMLTESRYAGCYKV